MTYLLIHILYERRPRLLPVMTGLGMWRPWKPDSALLL